VAPGVLVVPIVLRLHVARTAAAAADVDYAGDYFDEAEFADIMDPLAAKSTLLGKGLLPAHQKRLLPAH
jgi:hypothetical protein